MLRSLSSDVVRTARAAADADLQTAPAPVIDLSAYRARQERPGSGLHITPELLAALAASWSAGD